MYSAKKESLQLEGSHLVNSETVNIPDADGFTPFFIACKNRDMALAETLKTESGANINWQDPGGRTPFFWLFKKKYYDEADILMRMGADVNIPDNDSFTPLQMASYYNMIEWVEKLLRHGALVNQADEAGKTPLHHACSMMNEEIIGILIRNDADIHAKDLDGNSVDGGEEWAAGVIEEIYENMKAAANTAQLAMQKQKSYLCTRKQSAAFVPAMASPFSPRTLGGGEGGSEPTSRRLASVDEDESADAAGAIRPVE